MYPEFIPIYVGLAVAVILLVVLIVLAIAILKKLNNRPAVAVSRGGYAPAAAAAPQAGYAPVAAAPQAGSVVFCRSCGKQFDASMRFCPHCGANH